MKIRLKNFGILKQAEFELGDITIICGENNTGKTYAAYALFGFLSTWQKEIAYMHSPRIEQAIRDLLNDGTVQIDLAEYAVKNTEAILVKICKSTLNPCQKFSLRLKIGFKTAVFKYL